MGIKNQLTTSGSLLSQYDGATPPQTNFSTPTSKLHYQYSINGNPNITGVPTPSQLDLNGITPSKYLDNPPT